MHGSGQRCLVLAIETRQKPFVSIWDIGREEQTRLQCVSGDDARNGRWAGAAFADFDVCQAVVATLDKRVQLWDLRHLGQPVAESDPHVASSTSALHVHGLGTSRARAACSSQGGNINILDVTGEGGQINKLQTLYGHLDDLRWINATWPTEETQTEENVHAASLSVDGELLLWDFPWPLPDEEDEEPQKLNYSSDLKRNSVRSDMEDNRSQLSDNEDNLSQQGDIKRKSSMKSSRNKLSSFTKSFEDPGMDPLGRRRSSARTSATEETSESENQKKRPPRLNSKNTLALSVEPDSLGELDSPKTPKDQKMTKASSKNLLTDPEDMASDTQNGRQMSKSNSKTLSAEPGDEFPEVRKATLKSKGRRKLRMPDTKLTPRMLPTAGGLRTRAVYWEHQIPKDAICALTGTSSGAVHGWLQGDPSAGLQILQEAEAGAVQGHTDQVSAICGNFQAEVAVTASLDRTLRVWQIKADFFNCIEVLEGHAATIRALVCDFEVGRAVSGGADETVRIWDLGRSAGGSSAGSLGELPVPGSGVRELLASFSGGHAAAVTRDGSLRIWDLERLQQVALIDSHPGAVFAVQIGTELGTFGPSSESTSEETQTPQTPSRAALLTRMTRKAVQPAWTCGRGYSKSMW